VLLQNKGAAPLRHNSSFFIGRSACFWHRMVFSGRLNSEQSLLHLSIRFFA